MRKIALVLCVAIYGAFPLAVKAAEGATHQPVFLICPKKEKYSAWSLYVIPDKDNPAKIATLGLESLDKKNSADESFDDVVKAQSDGKTQREDLGKLDAKDFGSGKIEVKKDEALRVSITPESNGDYKLNVSMRIAASDRYDMGGKDERKRDLIFHYNKDKKKWVACVSRLEDEDKQTVVKAGSGLKEISGIEFPVTGTGIYEVWIHSDELGLVKSFNRGGMPDDR